MRYSEEVEDRIEDLTCDELRGVMDRIMRAAADRGYFGDDVAMSEIDRIIRNPRREGTSRLFPEELVEGKRTRFYPKTTFVGKMSKKDKQSVRYLLRKALREQGYEFEELDFEVERGMESRLSDLEDTISIDRFVRD
jgi:hypothetical protein